MYLEQIGDGNREFSSETRAGYSAMFGVAPEITAMAWEHLTERTEMDRKVKPKHLHDLLAALKVYASEENMTKMTRHGAKKPVTAKTHRKWFWKVVPALASLEGILVRSTVSYPNVIMLQSQQILWCISHNGCFEHLTNIHVRVTHVLNLHVRRVQIAPLWEKRTPGDLIVVDGTDCQVQERGPRWSGNFSHKFNGPGVRYEVITNREGTIIRVDGPYIAGCFPDAEIFRRGAMLELEPGETCQGDGIYRNQLPHVFPGDTNEEERKFANRVRARHETLNSRLKRFGILDQKFRSNDFEKHGWAFRAVAVLCQLEIQVGMGLFAL